MAASSPFYALNGYEWDLVMVFRVCGADEIITEAERVWPMARVLEHLGRGGLHYRLFYSIDRSLVMCKIRTPMTRLEAIAERLKHQLALVPAQLRRLAHEGRVDPLAKDRVLVAPFLRAHTPGVAAVGVPTPGQRAREKYGRFEHMYCAFNKADERRRYYRTTRIPGHPRGLLFQGKDRLLLAMAVLRDAPSIGGCGLDIDKLLTSGALQACFPLHEAHLLAELREEWIARSWWTWPNDQPFAMIRGYFGAKVALYFAFIGFYTQSMMCVCGAGALATSECFLVLPPSYSRQLTPLLVFHSHDFSTCSLNQVRLHRGRGRLRGREAVPSAGRPHHARRGLRHGHVVVRFHPAVVQAQRRLEHAVGRDGAGGRRGGAAAVPGGGDDRPGARRAEP